MEKRTTVSAPGKVLVTGGYLVLEKPNTGIVIATNSRFKSTVASFQQQNEGKKTNLVVESPQFKYKQDYQFSWTDGDNLEMQP